MLISKSKLEKICLNFFNTFSSLLWSTIVRLILNFSYFDLKDLIEGHYQITPYSFKPKVALKLIPKNYHDLGQGILDLIYEIYQDLIKDGKTIKYNKLS